MEENLETKDVIVSLLIILTYVIIVFSIISLPICIFKSIKCHSIGQMYDGDSDYGILKGCFVKINGKWVDYSKYKNYELE